MTSLLRHTAHYLLRLSSLTLLTQSELAAQEALSAEEHALLRSLCATQNDLHAPSPALLEEALALAEKTFPAPAESSQSTQKAQEEREKTKRSLSLLLPLLRCTSSLLSTGGDDRLTLQVEKNKENKYLCSTLPRTRAELLRRGNCTCTTLDGDDWACAEEERAAFVEEALSLCESLGESEAHGENGLWPALQGLLDERTQDVIERLKIAFGLVARPSSSCLETPSGSMSSAEGAENAADREKAPKIVLFPSGSDAEFLPLCLALVRSHNLLTQQQQQQQKEDREGTPRVLSVVSAAGEVGSGTAQASLCQHFSPLSPSGNPQISGSFLAGMRTSETTAKDGESSDEGVVSVKLAQFPPRESVQGQCVESEREKEIAQCVRDFLSADTHSVAVVHCVVGSKTGLIAPSLAFCESLCAEHGRERVLIVVDACQLRVRLSLLSETLSQGCVVLCTGSKFFAGPPFCGAVLLPAEAAKEIDTHCERFLSQSHAETHSEGSLTDDARQNAPAQAVPLLLPIEGLRDFLTVCEVDKDMPSLRRLLSPDTHIHTQAHAHAHTLSDTNTDSHALTHVRTLTQTDTEKERWLNLSLYLRWCVGLRSVERLRSLSQPLVERFCALWARTVRDKVRACAPWITLLDEELLIRAHTHTQSTQDVERVRENAGDVSTIVSLVFRVNVPHSDADTHSMRVLSADECKELHRLMTLSHNAHTRAPQQAVQLGQPVKLSPTLCVLRIALGADTIYRALSPSLHAQARTVTEEALLFDLTEAFSRSERESRRAFCAERESQNVFLRSVRETLCEDDTILRTLCALCASWPTSHNTLTQTTHALSRSQAERARSVAEIDERLSLSSSLPLQTHAPALVQRGRLRNALVALDGRHEQVEEVAIFYDLDALNSSFHSVKRAFEQELGSGVSSPSDGSSTVNGYPCQLKFLHCFALKSLPISYTLSLAVRAGLGVECASIVEAQQALLGGVVSPRCVVLDSPCKTDAELRFALSHGMRVNANSLAELARIAHIHKELAQSGRPSTSPIGLRVNPLVGAGANAALSTATQHSKFGVPLFSAESLAALDAHSHTEAHAEDSLLWPDLDTITHAGEVRDPCLSAIVNTFLSYECLSGVMCHVGSQGMPLSLMTQGVRRVAKLANLLDRLLYVRAVSEQPVCESERMCERNGVRLVRARRVSWIDIGGGLSANYDGDFLTPSFTEYASSIRLTAPELFGSKYSVRLSDGESVDCERLVITEFGKSLVTKCGVIVARVEDVLLHNAPAHADDLREVTCITHAGADLLLRTAYCRDKFPHRLSLWDAQHNELSLTRTEETHHSRPPARVTVAGPLCFSGDVLAVGQSLPLPQRGDEVVLWDCGANTLSLFSRHCSRASPVVYGFRTVRYECATTRVVSEVCVVQKIRERETDGEVIAFWK